MKGSEKFPGEVSLILGTARIYDALNDIPRGVQFYKKVCLILAIVCLPLWYIRTNYNCGTELFFLRNRGIYSVTVWPIYKYSCYTTRSLTTDLGSLFLPD